MAAVTGKARVSAKEETPQSTKRENMQNRLIRK
jgi:hypothetical protein